MKKQSKEELIAENARLSAELKEITTDFDGFVNTARKNLAKTLGIETIGQERYGNIVEELPEWSEIYAKIGELRTIARQKDQGERLWHIEDTLNRHLSESTEDFTTQ